MRFLIGKLMNLSEVISGSRLCVKMFSVSLGFFNLLRYENMSLNVASKCTALFEYTFKYLLSNTSTEEEVELGSSDSLMKVNGFLPLNFSIKEWFHFYVTRHMYS